MASEYDDTSSAIPWPVKIAFIILLAFAVWLAVGLIFATLRFARRRRRRVEWHERSTAA